MPPSHGVTTAGLRYPEALSQMSLLSPSLPWIHLPSSPSGAGRGVPPAEPHQAVGRSGLTAIRCERRHGRLSSCQPLEGWQPLSPQPTEQSLLACPQAQYLLSSLSPKQKLSGVPLLPGGDTPRGQQLSLLLQWTPELSVTQTCAKNKPTTLPDEEEADEASSVLLNSSVSLLVSSLDMLMAVI